MLTGQINQFEVLNFITVGHALFTIKNTQTGNRFTYRVTNPKDKGKESTNILFVSVPQFVHNKCTDKWAIKTGEERYVSEMGVRLDGTTDTVEQGRLGSEVIFDDSLSAVKAWQRLEIQRVKHENYLNKEIAVFKCQHTYQ